MEQENLKLKVSASPHVRSKATTSDIMFDVVIANAEPATAIQIGRFGGRFSASSNPVTTAEKSPTVTFLPIHF